MNKTWKLVTRKTVYSTKFLKVYEDKVQLPNGDTIDDYTIVEKPSVVMVVATDKEGELIILNEYKYAAGEDLLSLPAGHLKEAEDPIVAAKRELLEETGYGGDTFEYVGTLKDYPTKDLHVVHVVRATNVSKIAIEQHEDTESISCRLYSVDEVKKQIQNKEWKASGALASLTLTGVLF